ncbi:MAG: CAP domain-containing protein [Candidatus Lambdaproteobacteria bacterium]|nr:CAP domain-containing protein [Candidatus Lambdaproteobacteria bacterium]
MNAARVVRRAAAGAAAFLLALPAQGARAAELGDTYAHLERVRQVAGLKPFRRNALLEAAAARHARYLALNRTRGHFEQQGRPAFAGYSVAERTKQAGYSAFRVGENVATGNHAGVQSVDGLMTALYHRLGFLAFGSDEVGIGIDQAGPEERKFVFNMGDSALRAFCADPPASALFRPPGRYVELCPQGLRVHDAAYSALSTATSRGHPRVVLWPPPDGADVVPAFFDEDPDPLPDREVSGNPITVQFNPARVGRVRLLEFALFRADGAGAPGRSERPRPAPVGNTRVLTRASDPNRELTAHEFALFPLDRLDWNAGYRVRARFEADGREELLEWSFRTRALDVPLYTVQARGETVPVRAATAYALYIPPTADLPVVRRFDSSMPQGAAAQIDFIDGNTLRAVVTAPHCQTVTVRLGGERHVRLRVAGQDNTGAQHPEAELYKGCGEFAADFRIEGNGEVLPARSGAALLVYVRSGAVGQVRWRYPEDVAVSIDVQDEHTLRLSVRGPPGRTVEVQLAGGRSFRVKITGEP